MVFRVVARVRTQPSLGLRRRRWRLQRRDLPEGDVRLFFGMVVTPTLERHISSFPSLSFPFYMKRKRKISNFVVVGVR